MGCCTSRPVDDGDSQSSSIRETPTRQLNSRADSTQRARVTDHAAGLQASTSSLIASGSADAARQRNAPSSRLGPAGAKPVKGKALKPAPAAASIEAPLVSFPDGEPSPATTATMLRKARAEFFETRVTGSAEMWDVIRTVCGLVEDGALEDARAILEAAGGSCPTGHMWGKQGGCFDERGERYLVPPWCVGSPVLQEEAESVTGMIQHAEKASVDTDEQYETASASYSTEAKGKGKKMTADMFEIKGMQMSIKIRYSHTARDDTFIIGSENLLETLAQMAKERAEIPHDTKVRFVYLGRLLDHKRTLSDIAWHNDQLLSLFVFE